MKKSKPAKMQEKRDKMKEKAKKLASQLKGVVKAASTAATVLAVMILAGCQDTKPASRSNEASYGDLEPSIVVNGSSNTVYVTIDIGDGVYADASGGGDSQATTPTQTTDTKPEVAVGVGGGSAGTGGATPTAGLTDKAMSVLRGLGVLNPSNESAIKTALESACSGETCAPAQK